MIVIAIIGILAAIAMPRFNAHRDRAYKAECVSLGESAYKAAIFYFLDHPYGALAPATIAGLEDYGFRQSDNVDVTLINRSPENLTIRCEHKIGGQVITFHADGSFT
ncbi:MAG: hypothetical protein E4H15_08165 [Syntrophobacterales bacterium]|nr:MAG: hypothetical protein E4H15_08165 [Syntrophobacterales bacterium]